MFLKVEFMHLILYDKYCNKQMKTISRRYSYGSKLRFSRILKEC